MQNTTCLQTSTLSFDSWHRQDVQVPSMTGMSRHLHFSVNMVGSWKLAPEISGLVFHSLYIAGDPSGKHHQTLHLWASWEEGPKQLLPHNQQLTNLSVVPVSFPVNFRLPTLILELLFELGLFFLHTFAQLALQHSATLATRKGRGFSALTLTPQKTTFNLSCLTSALMRGEVQWVSIFQGNRGRPSLSFSSFWHLFLLSDYCPDNKIDNETENTKTSQTCGLTLTLAMSAPEIVT